MKIIDNSSSKKFTQNKNVITRCKTKRNNIKKLLKMNNNYAS